MACCPLRPAGPAFRRGGDLAAVEFGGVGHLELLPPGCHPGFWSAYQAAGGRADDALRARARGWALNFAIMFLAHSDDNPVLLEVGRRTLRTVLEDLPGPAQ